jgi:hypothetical protein
MDRLGEVDVISLSAWQVLFGGLFLAVVALAVPSAPIRWTPWMAGAMTKNVVLTSAVAILMWFYVLKVLPAGIAGLGSLATPVLGLFFAYILLGERFSFWEGWGGLLILAALALLVFQGFGTATGHDMPATGCRNGVVPSGYARSRRNGTGLCGKARKGRARHKKGSFARPVRARQGADGMERAYIPNPVDWNSLRKSMAAVRKPSSVTVSAVIMMVRSWPSTGFSN